MVSVRPGWLGVLVVVLIVVVCIVAVTAILYLVAPPIRRFIRKDQPVWWVRDIFIAVMVALLVLFGQISFLNARHSRDRETPQNPPQSQQGQAERIENLRFVRDKSAAAYQPRPFRQFDLSGMNLAGLQLNGANFAQADLSRANLTGTDLSSRFATPAAMSYLQGVNLCHAVLAGTNLHSAYLVNANLTGVDLTFTTLRGAVLNGSDLSGATLPTDVTSKDSPLAGIFYDNNTVWPQGFQPPPSSAGDPFRFLGNPVQNKLFGDLPRPKCDS
ncbi:pentapeptide repeat-containing protein [Mycobacterium sp. MMS18-G62]